MALATSRRYYTLNSVFIPAASAILLTAMPSIVNIAAYRFADLTELPELRAELRQLCKQQQLRGTILLSSEGINLFVAGTRQGVDQLLWRLRHVPGLGDLEVKESFSDERPFNRMLVKIKREIIPFGVEGIDPRRYTSRRLSAEQLKQWLDEGRPVTLLDTRNNFEVQAGTFRNAIPVDVDDFRNFPRAVQKLPEEFKKQTVVTFCTGGIRCEKAAPFLESAGFQDVYQLDGGILKYFETCGDAHYDGHCFVFDKRVAVGADLKEGGLQQCFVCQAVLSVEDQSRPEYVEGESCPYCYQSAETRVSLQTDRRNQALRQVTSPLPGSVPYDNVRPISVPLRCDGLELLDFLAAMKTQLTRDEWQQVCAERRLVCREEPVQPGRIVRAGERLLHCMPATIEPDVNGAVTVVYEDDAVVVVNKPAPLPMHPCGRFNRNTLSYLLDQVFAPLRLRPAHRLDADTSGIVVFSKSAKAARRLQPQFEIGSVSKIYLARVRGRPDRDRFECHLPLSGAPGPGGVRVPTEDGLSAVTRFELVRDFSDGTLLLAATPVTGRTNQIRVHAWALGLPIVGDRIYLPGRQLGTPQTLAVSDPPLCLHAASIEFEHPQSRERVRYEAPPPAWS